MNEDLAQAALDRIEALKSALEDANARIAQLEGLAKARGIAIPEPDGVAKALGTIARRGVRSSSPSAAGEALIKNLLDPGNLRKAARDAQARKERRR